MGTLQETLAAKCDLSIPISHGDLGVVNALGFFERGRKNLCSMHCGHVQERVDCASHWFPPELGLLKINID